MDCPKKRKCYVDGKYFVIACCEEKKRLLIYKSWKKGKGIKLLPPFDQLWFLPWELQTYAYMPNVTTNGPFELPKLSTSVLTAQTTPGNYVPLFWMTSSLDGPITSQGVELNTIFTGIDYRVTWRSDRPVKIGFYTQMAFLENSEDKVYPLIDNDFVLQLDSGIEGTFVMNYERFYVAASSSEGEEAVNLTLTVQVVIPEGCGDDRNQHLRVECCNYKVYKSKVVNFVEVQSFLNPQLKEIYRKIIETFKANAIPMSPVTPASSQVALQQQTPILTYYNIFNAGPPPSSILPGLPAGDLRTIGFVPYTDNSNFTSPPYPDNEFPARTGYIVDENDNNKAKYLGVRISNISFDIDIYYRITLRNDIIPRLKRVPIVSVIAQFFFGPGPLPIDVVVNGRIVSNGHAWIVENQNVPQETIITNVGGAPLRIPASFTNVALSIRPGSPTAPQPFEVAQSTISLVSDAVKGFATFNSVVAVPAGSPPPTII